jgi:hypothetical protein
MEQASDIISQAGPWKGRVKAWPARKPTWSHTSVLAVVEVEVEGLGIYQVHVVRARRGFLYAKSPSSKSVGTWIESYNFTDGTLRDAVHSVAIASYLAMPPAQEGCTVHGQDQHQLQERAPVQPAQPVFENGA